jgi:[ribosomal protein S5]-alanine N-acetyltransferase
MPLDLAIVTRRLLLRPLQRGDASALFQVFSDPAVMRYWSTPPWTDDVPAHRMIEQDQAGDASSDAIRLGLVRMADDQLIGTCTLFDRHAGSRRAEIGYALAQAAWGQGYMHEALVALLHHGFEAWDLHRVEADIDPRNEASARSLQRLGFQPEGLLRERWIVDGQLCDTAYYGLLRRDWQAHEASGTLQPEVA